MNDGSIAILGAGPAGSFAAMELARKLSGTRVTLVEAEKAPGGITASFEWKGMIFDHGSHRLHPATSPELLGRISELLEGHLLRRPRHGRIRLLDRFISFPLKPFELLMKLPPSFSAGVFRDMLLSGFRKPPARADFAETLSAGLGSTISRHFYFPYAEKLWGLPPGRISPVQAERRIAAGSTWKMLGKAMRSLLGREKAGGYFYYPADGFGEITGKAAQKFEKTGGSLLTGSPVVSITQLPSSGGWRVELAGGGSIEAHLILSTIPVTTLLNALGEAVPYEVAQAGRKLCYRAMVFLYLELKGTHYTEYDAHYFPGKELCFSRMSEPKNYRGSVEPDGRTGLCFEIPCCKDDESWKASSEELTRTVLEQLCLTGLPEPVVMDSAVRRKEFIYPVYDLDFKERFDTVDGWLSTLQGMVSMGRQGLFAHDNVHHTIEMGLAAAECVNTGLEWNHELWGVKRREFETHVVVD